MATIQRISPCLWFDNQAEEAARFYTSIFRNSKVGRISRYSATTQAIHPQWGPPGAALVVEFFLEGQPFTALNGGPTFKFTEAISLQVDCNSQEEVDYYWEKLLAGGGSEQQCGWLKDKYGLSWQVVPAQLVDMIVDPDEQKVGRVMAAMLKMVKLEIEPLRKAYAGGR